MEDFDVLAAIAVRRRHRVCVALLSTAEVAKELGVSPRTVARWVERGWVTPPSRYPAGRTDSGSTICWTSFVSSGTKAEPRQRRLNGFRGAPRTGSSGPTLSRSRGWELLDQTQAFIAERLNGILVIFGEGIDDRNLRLLAGLDEPSV